MRYITILYLLILFILPFNFVKRQVVVDKQIEYIKIENEVIRNKIVKYKEYISEIDTQIIYIKNEIVDDSTLINNLKYELNKNNTYTIANF